MPKAKSIQKSAAGALVYPLCCDMFTNLSRLYQSFLIRCESAEESRGERKEEAGGGCIGGGDESQARVHYVHIGVRI